MRLFIAIELEDKQKDALVASANEISGYFEGANYSKRENYHVTLEFLGEVSPSRIGDIKAAIDEAAMRPFDFSIGGYGAFRSRDKITLWRAIDAPRELYDAQKRLHCALAKRGFTLEERPFRPHMTVAREAIVVAGTDLRSLPFGRISCRADGISLMLSERTAGRLTYTRLYKSGGAK